MNLEERPPPGAAPPDDLRDRPLPLGSLAAGEILYRIHLQRHAPVHFSRSVDATRRSRWAAPDGTYGVCYLADGPHIAFAETLLRNLGIRSVHEDDLHVRSLARVEVVEAVRVVELHGPGLRRLGADAALVQGPYAPTWGWSGALHAHSDVPDGIRCRSRYDDSGKSIALFERTRHRIRTVDSTPLLDAPLRAVLTEWLERYHLGLTR